MAHSLFSRQFFKFFFRVTLCLFVCLLLCLQTCLLVLLSEKKNFVFRFDVESYMRPLLPNQSTFSPQDSLYSLKLRSIWWTLTVLVWSVYFGMNGKLVVVKTNCRPRISHTADCKLSFLHLRRSYALKLLCHGNCNAAQKHYRHNSEILKKQSSNARFHLASQWQRYFCRFDQQQLT